MKNMNSQSKILAHLFFSLLPVQILVVSMESINSIVDGVAASRGIDATTVGVIGLYYSMVRIFEAVSSVLLGGTAVICGRYLGRGDTKKIQGMFSLNLTASFFFGVILTFVNSVTAPSLAVALGADTPVLIGALVTYARGYAVGIIPMLLARQMAAFLQMENSSAGNYIGSACMIISNVALDIIFVFGFHMGLWGLGLATAIRNWIYFLILLFSILKKKMVFVYQISGILWEELGSMFLIGFPGAILIICLALRYLVINRLLIAYGGTGGVSATSAFNMITGLFLAVALGTGAVARMLTSVFIGEGDREAIPNMFRIIYTRVLLVCVGMGVRSS